LHSKALALESLGVSKVNLNVGKLLDNIVLANSVTSFNMDILLMWGAQTHRKWYTYIARKYTNLIDFHCNDMELWGVDFDDAMIIYRDGLIPIYKTLVRHLFSVTVANIPLELDLFNQLDHFGCQAEVCYLDNNGSTPLFTQLG
jgi:hypothetical protein